MKYPWLDEYLLNKPAAARRLQTDWNWVLYTVGEKMFAALCLDDQGEAVYLNVKTDPEYSLMLRQTYPDIIPGYYCNKRCWNSIRADGDVPDELVRDLADESYRLVLAGFSKKKQKEILGENDGSFL